MESVLGKISGELPTTSSSRASSSCKYYSSSSLLSTSSMNFSSSSKTSSIEPSSSYSSNSSYVNSTSISYSYKGSATSPGTSGCSITLIRISGLPFSAISGTLYRITITFYGVGGFFGLIPSHVPTESRSCMFSEIDSWGTDSALYISNELVFSWRGGSISDG
jgi:hypothetical protein